LARENSLTNLSAETRRFELLKGFTPYLVSSEAHSTGLCDVSLFKESLQVTEALREHGFWA